MKRPQSIALGVALLLALALLLFWSLPRGDRDTGGSVSGMHEDDAPGGRAARHHRDAGPTRATSTAPDAGALPAGPPSQPVRLSTPTLRQDPSAAVGTLSGRVVALGDGRGVAGATLTFEHEDRSASTQTAEDGSFRLAPDANGTYVLAVVGADGFLPFAPDWGQSPIRLEVRAGVHVEGIVVTLVDAIEYTVRVVDEAAAPVAGASVWVHGAESGERTLAPLAARHTTDAQGEATLIAPDGAVLEAHHPERGAGRAAVDAAAQVTRVVDLRLAAVPPESLRGQSRIQGRVVTSDAAAIEGARVSARYEGRPGAGDYALHPTLFAQSDAEGQFTLERVDRGTYTVRAEHAEHASTTLRAVASGRADVVLQLEEEARLRVAVVDDASEAPVAAATVVVERRTGALTQERVALVSGYDASASYEVGGLPEGPLELRAAAPGYAMSGAVLVVARAGEIVDVQVRLRRGGRVRGRVTSADGAPLSHARATLESSVGEGSSAVPIDVSGVSDARGDFVLEGITPGMRSLVIWAEGHHGRVRSGMVITEGEEVDLGVIDLTPLEEGERPGIELAGIGAVLSARDDVLVIGAVIDGGGAAEAGLISGDMIVRIEGVEVARLGFGGCIERLRGPEGTSVLLHVRGEDRAEREVRVPRRRIRA